MGSSCIHAVVRFLPNLPCRTVAANVFQQAASSRFTLHLFRKRKLPAGIILCFITSTLLVGLAHPPDVALLLIDNNQRVVFDAKIFGHWFWFHQ